MQPMQHSDRGVDDPRPPLPSPTLPPPEAAVPGEAPDRPTAPKARAGGAEAGSALQGGSRGLLLSTGVHALVLLLLAVAAPAPGARMEEGAPRQPGPPITLRLAEHSTIRPPRPERRVIVPTASPQDPSPLAEAPLPESLRRLDARPITPAPRPEPILITRVRARPGPGPVEPLRDEELVTPAIWQEAMAEPVPVAANTAEEAPVEPLLPEVDRAEGPPEEETEEELAESGPSLPAGNRRTPDYPRRCIRAGHEGVVELSLRIGEDGAVNGVTVVRSSGCPELDASARRTAETLRYTPATRGGRPVPGVATWRIEFRLDGWRR
ncbi:MAG: energy transducer TonB [Planctomycetota bacterium]